MRFEASQSMRLGQQMKLAPRMIQSMEILQLPLAELEERIEQELENNPTLELVEAEGAPRPDATDAGDDASPLRVDERAGVTDFERLDRFEEANPEAAENEFSASDYTDRARATDPGEPFEGRRPAGERDAKMDAMAAAPARAASLTDQLRDQWALCDVAPDLRPLGELIIAFLDDDGYLRTPLDTLADRAPISDDPARVGRLGESGLPLLARRPTTADLEKALRAAQLFLDPPGVAARDPRECLLLQLDAMEDDAAELGWPKGTMQAARRLIESHLDDLLQNRLPKVAERTGLSMEEIKEALTLMRRLSLAPGRRLVADDAPPITPDAIVEYDPETDRYVAYLNESRIPNLRVNQEYARLSKDRATPKKDREFLRTNLGNAYWLIDAVRQRKETLLRVVRAVVEAQRDAFDLGPQALKPLPMTQVAEQLGIHVATVSRAVADKYLATPRGILPLRKFFSGGLQTKAGEDGGGGGEELAWDAIKAALKEVVDAEDKASPHSDDRLVDELKKRGIEIARRTVAKYRDQLGIPTARLRKQF